MCTYLIVKNLNLECKVLVEVLNDHNKEGKLDSQGLFGIVRRNNVARRDICSHNFQHRTLNVLICYSFYVPILNL